MTLVALARQVHGGEAALEDAVRRAPYPVSTAREPLERALAQLRGELSGFAPPDPA